MLTNSRGSDKDLRTCPSVALLGLRSRLGEGGAKAGATTVVEIKRMYQNQFRKGKK